MDRLTQLLDQQIASRQEIEELLNIAKDYEWKLNFKLPGESNESTYQVQIFHVNAEEGYVTVNSEVSSSLPGTSMPILFAANEAGIKFEFYSEPIPYPGNPLAYSLANERRISFPDELIYEQQRRALRVNFSSQEEVPVTLYTGTEQRADGIVDDISTDGLKARLPGYLTELFEEASMKADCNLVLPDKTRLKCRVEILGTKYDFDSDSSFVRCRFLEKDSDTEIKLREVISQALTNLTAIPSA